MSASVLIVDDSAINVKLLEARLLLEHFEVRTANTGADALNICQRHNVDLLLLDLEMPHMTGFEVCRRLRSNVRTHHIPIMVLTAHDEDTEKAKAYRMGADDVLIKPIDYTALKTRVQNLLKQKKLKEEISKIQFSSELSGLSAGESQSLFEIFKEQGDARLLFLDETTKLISKVSAALSDKHNLVVQTSLGYALQPREEPSFDLLLCHVSQSSDEVLSYLKDIRAQSATAHLPILWIVGPDLEILPATLTAGVNDYVKTPLNLYDLSARVQGLLTLKRLSQHLKNLGRP